MYRDDLPPPSAELLVSGAREELPAPTDEYYARTLLYIDRVSPKNILLYFGHNSPKIGTMTKRCMCFEKLHEHHMRRVHFHYQEVEKKLINI